MSLLQVLLNGVASGVMIQAEPLFTTPPTMLPGAVHATISTGTTRSYLLNTWLFKTGAGCTAAAVHSASCIAACCPLATEFQCVTSLRYHYGGLLHISISLSSSSVPVFVGTKPALQFSRFSSAMEEQFIPVTP